MPNKPKKLKFEIYGKSIKVVLFKRILRGDGVAYDNGFYKVKKVFIHKIVLKKFKNGKKKKSLFIFKLGTN